MAKSSKPKKNQFTNIKGNVSGNNVIIGDGNVINSEIVKIAFSLFTIPLPVTDFTGRETELEQLKTSFKNGAIITGVSGGGGVGKTELARKLSQDIAEDYPDARMSIDLQGMSESPLDSEEAMRHLLEPFYPNQKLSDAPEQLKGLYQETFSNQKVLLLLDNAANANQVRPLIPPAPSAAIITSRRNFSLTEFGLSEPLQLDVLSPADSVELLKTASPKLLKELTDEEVNALAKLCGNLPLALRVAASLLNDRKDWNLNILLERLQDERTRLKQLQIEDDLNVESVISLSYNLLEDELKLKLAQLGVFTAPFLNLSAAAVWELEDKNIADDFLGKLINRSLLNILPSSVNEDQQGNLYALHDLTRLFALNELKNNADKAKAAIMRHADHFLEWAIRADDLYEQGSENILVALRQFRFIYPHLFSAYERLLPENDFRPPQADDWLSNFPGRCVYVLDLHLSPRQKIPILESALGAAGRLNEKQAEGIHLGNLGLAYAALGDARKAIQFYEQCLELHREIGDRRGEGAVLGNLGLAYAALGDARKAIQFYEQCLELHREIRNRRGEGAVLGNLGIAYKDLGDAHKAIEFYEQQLVIVREIGDRRGEGATLGNFGTAYKDLGEIEKAIEFYEQALIIAREIGDLRGEGAVLNNLGIAYKDLGEIEKAIEFYEQRIVIAREIGDRRGEGVVLGNLGIAYKDLGEIEKAIEFYEQRIVIAREIGDRRGEGNALNNLGLAYADLGEIEKAIQLYEQALIIAREIGDRRGEGNALNNLGIVYEDLGEKEKARETWESALAIFRAIESPHVANVEKWLADLGSDSYL